MKLLSANLESGYSRRSTIRMIAMTPNLGTSTQVPTAMSEIKMKSIIDVLFSGPGDLEKGMEEAADLFDS
jgi:hypothetical protein